MTLREEYDNKIKLYNYEECINDLSTWLEFELVVEREKNAVLAVMVWELIEAAEETMNETSVRCDLYEVYREKRDELKKLIEGNDG